MSDTAVKSVFAKYEPKAYEFRYAGQLVVGQIMGGTPSDPKVAEGFLKKKLGITSDQLLQQATAELMVERGVDAEQALTEVKDQKYLNGFKRNENGLYIEGRQLKAAIKEAASVARAVGKLPPRWGLTNKGIQGFVAEHIFVEEDILPLGVTEPSGILQSFPKNPMTNQSSIRYEEYVEDAKISFHVESDYEFKDEEWAMLWLTGERQGLGASRSQGYGTYKVVSWERVKSR